MRIAAGILMIMLGGQYVGLYVDTIIKYGASSCEAGPVSQFLMICGAFLAVGGVFCLTRRYWRVCLASASFAVLLHAFFAVWWPERWLWIVGAIMAGIFISLRKREWKESSDSVDGKVSHDG